MPMKKAPELPPRVAQRSLAKSPLPFQVPNQHLSEKPFKPVFVFAVEALGHHSSCPCQGQSRARVCPPKLCSCDSTRCCWAPGSARSVVEVLPAFR